jgi:hypothetical protein
MVLGHLSLGPIFTARLRRARTHSEDFCRTRNKTLRLYGLTDIRATAAPLTRSNPIFVRMCESFPNCPPNFNFPV